MKKLIPIFVLSLLSFNSLADNEGFYFGLGGGAMTFEDAGETINNKQFLMRLGYDFIEYFGVGFEGGFSVIEDEISGVSFDVSPTFLYLRLSLPFGDSNKLYAMAGPTNVELSASVQGYRGYSISADESDSGAGVGLEIGLDNGAVFMDYISYFDDDGVEVRAANIGFTSYF